MYGADQMKCPACGAIAEAESVDVGVGLYVRADSFTCTVCDWVIDGPEDFGFIEEHEIEFAPPETFDAERA